MRDKTNQVDRVYPMSHFKTHVANTLETRDGLTDSDFHIVLTHLSRDKSAIIYDSQVSAAVLRQNHHQGLDDHRLSNSKP